MHQSDTDRTDSDRTAPRRRRSRLLGLLALGLAGAGLGGSVLSLALFTDTQSVSANAFSSGTIDLGASPSSALLSFSDMLPGDSVDGTLAVSNDGTGALRYAMTSSATNGDAKGLRDVVTLSVKDEGSGCAAFDGTTLYSGALNGASFGDATAGDDTGDRTLAALAGETLCFRASLPIGTGNAYQGAATTATFTFEAEQTANNP